MIANNNNIKRQILRYKARPSEIGRLASSIKFGLTDSEQRTLDKLNAKIKDNKKLTALQSDSYKQLNKKKDGVVYGVGAYTMAKEKLIELIFGVKKSFVNKYTEKGIIKEVDAIMMYNQVFGTEHQKNYTRFENDFLTGEPDIVADELLDIKNSWDLFTFPFFTKSIPKQDYIWQLKGYNVLLNDEGIYPEQVKLVYCLMDTPENIIQDELYKKARELGVVDLPEAWERNIRNSLTFSDKLAPEQRIKVFDIPVNYEQDKQDIERLVIAFRNLMLDLYEQL